MGGPLLIDLGPTLAEFPGRGRVAVYGRHLATGEEVALDADRRVSTGSAAKVLVLLAYADADVARLVADAWGR